MPIPKIERKKMANWVEVQDKDSVTGELHAEGIFTAELVEYLEVSSLFSDEPEWRFNFKTDSNGGGHVLHYTDRVLKREKKLGLMAVALLEKSYDDIKSSGGFDMDDLVGKKCKVNIKHQVSQKGRTYAKIESFITSPNV